VAERDLKKRTLGITRLIAELYKKSVVKEPVVHVCISELLGSPNEKPLEDNVEVGSPRVLECVMCCCEEHICLGHVLRNQLPFIFASLALMAVHTVSMFTCVKHRRNLCRRRCARCFRLRARSWRRPAGRPPAWRAT
jgi:hypothetical protein